MTATLRGGIQVSKRTWTQPNELDSGYETRSNYDTDFDKGYAIGYTRHNLFGRNLVAKVALSGGVGGYSNRLGENFRTSLALPLSRSSVVQAEFGGRFHEESRTSTGYQGGEFTRKSRYSSDRLTVNWQSDTTDDPFTPRQGRRIGSTLEHGWSYNSTPFDTYFFPEPISRQLETRSRGIVTEGRGDWFWPLTNRVSMGAGATLGANVASSDVTLTEVAQTTSESVSSRAISGAVTAVAFGTIQRNQDAETHFWWELRTSLSGSRWHSEGENRDGEFPSDLLWEDGSARSVTATVSATLAARGRWGTARLSFSYSHVRYSTDQLQ